MSEIHFVFPVLGKKLWGLEKQRHEEYVAAFPAVNVQVEYQQILSWLNSNPKNQKTPDGMPRFLHNWLKRTQNQAPRVAPKPADARCAFHRAYGTIGKLPRQGEFAGCPECKHAAAARGERKSDPTPLLDAMPEWATKDYTPATPEQLAELRRARGGGA